MSATTREDALKVIQAALADTGHDPEAVFIGPDGRVHFHTARSDKAVVWRAYEIARQAVGVSPCCRACLDAYNATGRDVKHCEAPRMFVEDCGAER
jgi:hypothetical protein